MAWNAEVDEILKRRWVGHRAGSDVFAIVYALDRRLLSDLRPAVKVLEEQIDREVGGSLLTTTSRRLSTAGAGMPNGSPTPTESSKVAVIAPTAAANTPNPARAAKVAQQRRSGTRTATRSRPERFAV